MPEELQHLLKRIQTEAVDQAEKQAEEILSSARRKAAALVREAEEQARTLQVEAEREASVYTDRSQRALEQAGRDLLISIGNGVEKLLCQLMETETRTALDTSFVQSLLDKMITHYVDSKGAGESVEVLVGKQDQADLCSFAKSRWKEQMAEGVRIEVDETLDRGFRVNLKGSNLYHDFSSEAIAEAMAGMLQPNLAGIVQRVAREVVSAHSEQSG
jgi:V/A-type H+-transporting ATPase subunit E